MHIKRNLKKITYALSILLMILILSGRITEAKAIFPEIDDAEGSNPLYVLVFADEEERAHDYTYWGDWKDYASMEIEGGEGTGRTGDEKLVDNFGIDIRILDFLDWQSNNAHDEMADLIQELKQEKGHYINTYYEGQWWSNHVDALIAITGQIDDYIGQPQGLVDWGELEQGFPMVMLNWFQNFWADDNLVQHEVSHLFWADECNVQHCAMSSHEHTDIQFVNEDPFGLIFVGDIDPACALLTGYWDEDCYQAVYSHRQDYLPQTCMLNVRTYLTDESELFDVLVWIDDDTARPSWVDAEVGYGYHSIEVESYFVRDRYEYAFQQWQDGSTDNPRNEGVFHDKTLRAYYEKTLINDPPTPPSAPSGSSSGYRNVVYDYSTSTTDPDGDDIRYQIEISGEGEYFTDTSAFVSSGTEWIWYIFWETDDPLGDYEVRTRAQDTFSEWSNWSPPLPVTIVNRPPVIDTYYPTVDPTISEGENQEFSITKSDADLDPLTVAWYLNTVELVGTSDSYTYFAETGSAGTYTVMVIVSDGYSQEIHEWILTVEPLAHDVAVTNVDLSKTVVGQGYIVEIDATVKNEGDFTETFNVQFYISPHLTDSVQVTLDSGDSQVVTFIWNTTDYDFNEYALGVAAVPVPGEIDIDDNILVPSTVIVTIPGDVNGDCIVDIFDIVLIAGAYGTFEGDPLYISNCDIDCDGDIDIFDTVIASGNYGQSCQ